MIANKTTETKEYEAKETVPFDAIRDEGPWTQFWDMHSGGDQKETWHYIYIQAVEEEAVRIFYNRFDHSPHRVSCTCCGSDYSVTEYESLSKATSYHRRDYDNATREVIPLSVFVEQEDVLIIPEQAIRPEERVGDVPEQGYRWSGG